MSAEDELFARADELMRNAPGTVRVARISHIDDVRLLRKARALLTPDEQARLRHVRLELMERLDGAVDATAPETGGRAPRGPMDRLLAALARGGQKMRSQGTVGSSGPHHDRPMRLPAPAELLDAAEAWLVAMWIRDRIDDELSPLGVPWQQSSLRGSANEPLDP